MVSFFIINSFEIKWKIDIPIVNTFLIDFKKSHRTVFKMINVCFKTQNVLMFLREYFIDSDIGHEDYLADEFPASSRLIDLIRASYTCETVTRPAQLRQIEWGRGMRKN